MASTYANVAANSAVLALNGPSTVWEAGELVDSANSTDSGSLDPGGRSADATKSVHYHHRNNGYSCHGHDKRVTLVDPGGRFADTIECVCVCVVLTTGSGELPYYTVSTARLIHPPQCLRRHNSARLRTPASSP